MRFSIDLKELPPRTLTLILVITAFMFALYLYGEIWYPDAPIRPCAASTGYCGKQNTIRTLSEYEAYEQWRSLMLFCWPIGVLTMIGIVNAVPKRNQPDRQ